jgi:hypothetical protein
MKSEIRDLIRAGCFTPYIEFNGHADASRGLWVAKSHPHTLMENVHARVFSY